MSVMTFVSGLHAYVELTKYAGPCSSELPELDVDGVTIFSLAVALYSRGLPEAMYGDA